MTNSALQNNSPPSQGRGGGGGAVWTLWRRSLRALFLRLPFAIAPAPFYHTFSCPRGKRSAASLLNRC